MTRPFVVVRKTQTLVTDLDDRFVELNEIYWGNADVVCLRPIDLAFTIFRMKRVLSKDVFDVGDEQLLMLLLVMNAERNERLKFRQGFFISIRQEIVDVRIDRRTILFRLIDGRSRDQAAQVAPMHIAGGIVIRIKKISVLRNCR